MIFKSLSSVWLVALFALLASFSIHCSKQAPSTQTLQLWHFWSEPAQQQAFLRIIQEFEKEHPGVKIECTPLQWSDGKAKLQTAIGSGVAPDIIHIGLEWLTEFASAGALESLDSRLVVGAHPSLRSNLQSDSMVYGLPWVMNCRALFLNKRLLEQASLEDRVHEGILSLDDLEKLSLLSVENQKSSSVGVSAARLPFGVNAYEPHNVLKKTLPFLWSAGSRVFCFEPFSQSIDEAALRALERYAELCKNGRVESSRQLDEAMARSELSAWPSGMWNLGKKEVDEYYRVSPRWPSLNLSQKTELEGEDIGWSILSADCYALTKQSAHKALANALFAFLARPSVQRAFCAAVPDAGFPAYAFSEVPALNEEALDTLFKRSPNAVAFYKQCMHARPLPRSKHFLEAEQLFEAEIMQVVYGKKSARTALKDLQEALRSLELRSATALRK